MGSCDAKELLCSRCVPQLSSNSLVTIWKRDSFEFKFNTVGCFRFFLKISLCHSKQKIGLANLLVSDDDKFVEKIKGLLWVLESPGSGFVQLKCTLIGSDPKIAPGTFLVVLRSLFGNGSFVRGGIRSMYRIVESWSRNFARNIFVHPQFFQGVNLVPYFAVLLQLDMVVIGLRALNCGINLLDFVSLTRRFLRLLIKLHVVIRTMLGDIQVSVEIMLWNAR